MSGRLWYAVDRRHQTGGMSPAIIGLGVLAALLVLVPGAIWIAGQLGGAAGPSNPWAYVVWLAMGELRWTRTASLWLGVLVVGGVAVGLGILVTILRSRGRKNVGQVRIDRKASSMATGRELAALAPAGAAADAQRLRSVHVGSGNPLGTHVVSGQSLRASYEWVQTWILGPRAGKTSCVCVPQILENRAPVIATSNKRDIVDLTRGPRSEWGRCWVFDPQGLIGETQQVWWDPLNFIRAYPDRMVERADELAALFNASVSSEDGRPDPYFEPEGEAYLASLLLAATIANEPISGVWRWMMDPGDLTPMHLLQLEDFPIAAEQIQSIAGLPEEQRGGVVGTARKMVPWLRSPAILRWVTPQPGMPQFDEFAFITSTQTVYAVSREGAGTARAVMGALTVAILQAGEHIAGRSPGGRLATPLMAILDEAANVVRWRDLPDMYSHFGSRGICVSAFLQGWSQGVEAWGERGMMKLWSASNIRVVGSGLAEEPFLAQISRLIGDHDIVTRSASAGSTLTANVSTNTQLHREAILEVSELEAMPPGRAVLLAAGMRAGILRLDHWSTKPYRDAVADSRDHYENALVTTGGQP
ncbi:conjugal transfer protein TraG [Enemella evansiae]|uniref:type IV secretory system conjugative DNA transfer family protein n=1 Tax=Enemella evansiae TaxID=2016499 RepID=UPI000B968BF1|nr:TraM recognition domain-containing protein [Enemella evansiae]OYO15524.1 conjugal transfer protein TraG [Enemella evansiae]